MKKTTTANNPELLHFKVFTLIGIIYSIVSAILYHLETNESFLFFEHLLSATCFVANYTILQKTGAYNRSRIAFLIIANLLVISLFITGGWKHTGYLWTFAYLPFAFFLSGRQENLFWVFQYFITCVIISLLAGFQVFSLPYSQEELWSFLAVLGVLTLFIFLYHRENTYRKESFLAHAPNLLAVGVDPFFCINETGDISDVNKAAEKMTGLSITELIDLPFASLFVDPGKAELMIRQILNEEIVHNYPLSFHADGSSDRFELIFNASLYVDEKNNSRSIFASARDISEPQKHADDHLKKIQKEIIDYKFALDESCIVAITDQKGIIQYVNDFFCKISKFNRHELIGQDHRIINSGYHSKEFIRNIWVTIANGQIWKGELKNKAKDGSTYWVDTTIVPFLDEKGKPYQYVAIRSDITQRKISEEQQEILEIKVKSQREELAMILEKINDGFIMVDNDFRYQFVNKEIGKMVGLDPAGMIGKSIWDIFPDAVGTSTYNAFYEARDKQKYISNIDYFEPLDLWQENRIYPGPNGLSVFIRDISEQKKAEEKVRRSERLYKTIASSIPGTVICLLDTEYRYTLIEGDMLEKFGFTKDLLLGQKAQDVLPPELFEEIRPNLERAFRGESFRAESTRLAYDIITSYVPFSDENGKVYKVMLSSNDVTELKKAERNISELNKTLEEKVKQRTVQLETVNQELEAFTYSVSHDLRAPLRIIDGFANILTSDYAGKLDEEGNRTLSVIKNNAQKMGQLIDDLLHLSRLGRQQLQMGTINMNDMVNKVIDESRLLTGHLAEIICDPLPDAIGDRNLVNQVWTNLISNAIKYSSKKAQPHIHIGSTVENGKITYFIQDNGIGFDMKYAGKLFGVFQRLHKHSEFDGTGVGLTLVQRIIHKHGGNIRAEAIPDKGARFIFSLPESIYSKNKQTFHN